MNAAKTWFWILLNVLIFFLTINVIFFVMPMLQGLERSFTPSRTITVSAQGKTTATPDEADISFSVVSQGADPQSLSANNDDKMSAVLQFVSSQGIASSDIATTGYDLEPNYEYNKATDENIISGYTLTQTVEVKIRNLNNVAAVLGGLAPLGVNEIGGVDFTFQDSDNFVAIARAQAIQKAQQEAQEMASEAGTSLGEVVSVNESQNIPGPLPIYSNEGVGIGAMAAPSSPTIDPGTQDITDEVTITYALQ